MLKQGCRVTCAVHPDAFGLIESDGHGNIRTEAGSRGYVLQDGTRVTL